MGDGDSELKEKYREWMTNLNIKHSGSETADWVSGTNEPAAIATMRFTHTRCYLLQSPLCFAARHQSNRVSAMINLQAKYINVVEKYADTGRYFFVCERLIWKYFRYDPQTRVAGLELSHARLDESKSSFLWQVLFNFRFVTSATVLRVSGRQFCGKNARVVKLCRISVVTRSVLQEQ